MSKHNIKISVPYYNRKIKLLVWNLIFILAFVSYSFAECLPHPTVENGTLIKDCQPYRAAGVNYFDAFYRTLKNPADKSYKEGLKKLSQKGIPFIRVMISGFWPKDWELYLKNKEQYFSLLDEFIRTAEEHKIGLVLNLFWNVSTIPDIVGEPISAWGDPNSKTIAFMKEFTREIVSRYKGSPSVWIWEFGNEYNLVVDLPKPYEKVAPQYGTPAKRTEKDRLSWKDITTAFVLFANEVRKIDPYRPISTGSSILRGSSYHLAFFKTWDNDNQKQLFYMLHMTNPPEYDVVSVHVYPTNIEKNYSGYGLYHTIKMLKDYSEKLNKMLFIGEFGVCRDEHATSKEDEKIKFEELITAIRDAEVPLAALWVYDFKGQDKTCNVTFENDRAYQLDYIIGINRAIQRVRSK
jgi:hypothetical protein